jgi:hypothetical protein
MQEITIDDKKCYVPEVNGVRQINALRNCMNAIITKSEDCIKIKRIGCDKCVYKNNKNYIDYLKWAMANNIKIN